MIMWLWLCSFPMTLGLMAMWQEQLDWHHAHAAIHKLYGQQAKE